MWKGRPGQQVGGGRGSVGGQSLTKPSEWDTPHGETKPDPWEGESQGDYGGVAWFHKWDNK